MIRVLNGLDNKSETGRKGDFDVLLWIFLSIFMLLLIWFGVSAIMAMFHIISRRASFNTPFIELPFLITFISMHIAILLLYVISSRSNVSKIHEYILALLVISIIMFVIAMLVISFFISSLLNIIILIYFSVGLLTIILFVIFLIQFSKKNLL